MSEQIQPIQEEDYPKFMAWVHSQPADTVIATSCHSLTCVVARWYCEVTDHPVYVTILKHFLSENDLINDNYQYNPYWVRGVTEALDKYAEGYTRDITQQEFVNNVLPLAYRWGVSKLV